MTIGIRYGIGSGNRITRCKVATITHSAGNHDINNGVNRIYIKHYRIAIVNNIVGNILEFDPDIMYAIFSRNKIAEQVIHNHRVGKWIG